jgi:hypothetical protein
MVRLLTTAGECCSSCRSMTAPRVQETETLGTGVTRAQDLCP